MFYLESDQYKRKWKQDPEELNLLVGEFNNNFDELQQQNVSIQEETLDVKICLPTIRNQHPQKNHVWPKQSWQILI